MSLMSWGLYPRTENIEYRYESDKILKQIVAEHNELIPYGNGRSYGDSALSSRIINVKPHACFIDFVEGAGLLHVQAGVLLAEILETFVPRGWFLKVTPGTKLITVGGAIASDVHGKNHHVAGCFSEYVKEFTIMLPGSEIVTCSRETRPELFRATCGGQGLTGVILDAKIFLKRINSKYLDQTTIKTKNLRETFQAFEEYRELPYSVAWIDCLAKGDALGQCLLMVADFRDDGELNYRDKGKISVPVTLPAFVLNKWSVRAFNRLYYGKVKKRVSRQKVDIDSFFYPLDAIGQWNRIYGKNGFTQYQFILPKDRSCEGLEEMLRMIADSGKGSFLAVLKLYGPANANYLSFPLEGYSLALDFKIEEGLFGLLARLDEIVVKNHGRIYLAKDVRVSKETFEKGYPQIDTFRQFRIENKMVPRFQSLQSKRVGI